MDHPNDLKYKMMFKTSFRTFETKNMKNLRPLNNTNV